MGAGRKLTSTFSVPTSGTFYTKHFSNKLSDLCSIHLFSKDPVVVTDAQYQTSNWHDERDLSGAAGNIYWYTEELASFNGLTKAAFTGSENTSVVCHVSCIGTQYFRLKISCNHSGTFVMNAYTKDD